MTPVLPSLINLQSHCSPGGCPRGRARCALDAGTVQPPHAGPPDPPPGMPRPPHTAQSPVTNGAPPAGNGAHAAAEQPARQPQVLYGDSGASLDQARARGAAKQKLLIRLADANEVHFWQMKWPNPPDLACLIAVRMCQGGIDVWGPEVTGRPQWKRQGRPPTTWPEKPIWRRRRRRQHDPRRMGGSAKGSCR